MRRIVWKLVAVAFVATFALQPAHPAIALEVTGVGEATRLATRALDGLREIEEAVPGEEPFARTAAAFGGLARAAAERPSLFGGDATVARIAALSDERFLRMSHGLGLLRAGMDAATPEEREEFGAAVGRAQAGIVAPDPVAHHRLEELLPPEFLSGNATPEEIADALWRLPPERRAEIFSALSASTSTMAKPESPAGSALHDLALRMEALGDDGVNGLDPATQESFDRARVALDDAFFGIADEPAFRRMVEMGAAQGADGPGPTSHVNVTDHLLQRLYVPPQPGGRAPEGTASSYAYEPETRPRTEADAYNPVVADDFANASSIVVGEGLDGFVSPGNDTIRRFFWPGAPDAVFVADLDRGAGTNADLEVYRAGELEAPVLASLSHSGSRAPLSDRSLGALPVGDYYVRVFSPLDEGAGAAGHTNFTLQTAEGTNGNGEWVRDYDESESWDGFVTPRPVVLVHGRSGTIEDFNLAPGGIYDPAVRAKLADDLTWFFFLLSLMIFGYAMLIFIYAWLSTAAFFGGPLGLAMLLLFAFSIACMFANLGALFAFLSQYSTEVLQKHYTDFTPVETSFAQDLTRAGFPVYRASYGDRPKALPGTYSTYAPQLATLISEIQNDFYMRHRAEPGFPYSQPEDVKVDIVAHSMGGLVSRWYTTDPSLYEGDVGKLIMLGTPNGGSTPAQWLFDVVDSKGAEFLNETFIYDAIFDLAFEFLLLTLVAQPIGVAAFLKLVLLLAIALFAEDLIRELVGQFKDIEQERADAHDLLAAESEELRELNSRPLNPNVNHAAVCARTLYIEEAGGWFDILVAEKDVRAIEALGEVQIVCVNTDHGALKLDRNVVDMVGGWLQQPDDTPLADQGSEPPMDPPDVGPAWGPKWCSLRGLVQVVLGDGSGGAGMLAEGGVAAPELADARARIAERKGLAEADRLATIRDMTRSASDELRGNAPGAGSTEGPIETAHRHADAFGSYMRDVAPSEGYYASADVGVLRAGAFTDARSLLVHVGEPSELVRVGASASEHARHGLLLAPTGSLAQAAGSPVAPRALERYVREGGTLLAFAPRSGSDWQVLPGGDALAGFGVYEEDGATRESVRLTAFVPGFASQTRATPDLNVQGFLTRYPANATVLMVRASNGEPAAVLYPWGEGRVVVTTLTPDHTQGSLSREEVLLVRDLVHWLRHDGPVEPAVAPGASLDVPVRARLPADAPAADAATLVLLAPDLAVVREQATGRGLAPGEEATFTLTGAAPQATGLYAVDVQLSPSGRYVDAARFPVSALAGDGSVLDHQVAPLAASVTSSSPRAVTGQDVEFTFTVRNRGETARDVVVEWWYPEHAQRTGDPRYGGGPAGSAWEENFRLTRTLTVPAGGSASFVDPLAGLLATDAAQARFVADGQVFAEARRGVNVFDALVALDATTSTQRVARGGTLQVQARFQDLQADPLTPAYPARLVARAISQAGVEIWREESEVGVVASPRVRTYTITIPLDAAPGVHRVELEAFQGTTKLGRDVAHFDVTAKALLARASPPDELRANATAPASWYVENVGLEDVTDGVLVATLKAPSGATLWSGTRAVSLAVGQNATYVFDVQVPGPLSLGVHALASTLTYDAGALVVRASDPLVHRLALTLAPGGPRYAAGDAARVQAQVANAGVFHESVTLRTSAPFASIAAEETLDLAPGTSRSFSYDGTVRADLVAGAQAATLSITTPAGERRLATRTVAVPPAEPHLVLETSALSAPGLVAVRVENRGGLPDNGTYEATLRDDAGFVVARATGALANLSPRASTRVLLALPAQSAQGVYQVDARTRDATGAPTAALQASVDVTGTAAALDVAPSAAVFFPGDTTDALAKVQSTGGIALEGARLALDVRKALPDPAWRAPPGPASASAFARDGGSVWHANAEGAQRRDALTGALLENVTGVGAVRDVAPGDDAVWLATAAGVVRLARADGARTTLAMPDARALSFDDDGMLWVATRQGAARVDPTTLAVERVRASSGGLPHDDVRDVDAYGNDVWFATAFGLARLTRDTGAWSLREPGRGSTAVDADARGVAAAVTEAGVAWEEPRDQSGSAPTIYPSIARAPDGSVHMVYQHGSGDASEIYWRKVDASGATLRGPTRLTNAAGFSEVPSIASDGTGNMHVVWTDTRTGTHRQVWYMKIDGEGRKLVADKQVTFVVGGDINWPQWPNLTRATDGTLHVVFEDKRDPTNLEVYWKRLDANGTQLVNDVRVTSSPGSSGLPTVAVGPDGVGHVTWFDSRSGTPEIYYRRLNATGALVGPELRVTNGTSFSHGPKIALDGQGRANIVWHDDGAPNGAGAATPLALPDEPASGSLLPTSTWGDPAFLGPSAQFGNFEIYLQRVASDALQGAPMQLSRGPAFSLWPSVTVDGEDTLHVAWQDNRHRPGNRNDTEFTGVYDIFYAQVAASGVELVADQRAATSGFQDLWRPKALVLADRSPFLAFYDRTFPAVQSVTGAYASAPLGARHIDLRTGATTVLDVASGLVASDRVVGVSWGARELWVATADKGVSAIDVERGARTLHRAAPGGLRSDNATALLADDHAAWVGTIAGPAYYERYADRVVWSRNVTVTTADNQSSEERMALAGQPPGRYILRGQLTSATGQPLALDEAPVVLAATRVSVQLDATPRAAAPGGLVQVVALVTNHHELPPGSLQPVRELEITIARDDLGTLHTSPRFALAAGETRRVEITTTAGGSAFALEAVLRKGAAVEARVQEHVRVVETDVSLAILAPDVAGRAPFEARTIVRNAGARDADLLVTTPDGATHPLRVGARREVALPTRHASEDDTTLVARVEGDAQATAQKPVRQGERARVTLLPDPAYPEGARVPVEVLVENVGLLDLALAVTYTVAGQTIARDYALAPGASARDTLVVLDLAAGEHRVAATHAFGEANATFLVTPEARVEVELRVPREAHTRVPADVLVRNLGPGRFVGDVLVDAGFATALRAIDLAQAGDEARFALLLDAPALPAGRYDVEARVRASGDDVARAQAAFVVPDPRFAISRTSPASTTLLAGGNASASYLVENVGGSEGVAFVEFTAAGLDGDRRQVWLAPGQSASVTFALRVDAQAASGERLTRARVGEAVADGLLRVVGQEAALAATLPAREYARGANATVNVSIDNTGTALPGARVRAEYAGRVQEQEIDLAAGASRALSFVFETRIPDKVQVDLFTREGRRLAGAEPWITVVEPAAPVRFTPDRSPYPPCALAQLAVVESRGGGELEHRLQSASAPTRTTLPAGSSTLDVQLPCYGRPDETLVWAYEGGAGFVPLDVEPFTLEAREVRLESARLPSGMPLVAHYRVHASHPTAAQLRTWIEDTAGRRLGPETSRDLLLAAGETAFPVVERVDAPLAGPYAYRYRIEAVNATSGERSSPVAGERPFFVPGVLLMPLDARGVDDTIHLNVTTLTLGPLEERTTLVVTLAGKEVFRDTRELVGEETLSLALAVPEPALYEVRVRAEPVGLLPSEARRLVRVEGPEDVPTTRLAVDAPHRSTNEGTIVHVPVLAGLRLEASDARSGVASTHLSRDGEAYEPYAGAFQAPAAGALALRFFSVDRVGNAERARDVLVLVDAESPSVRITRPMAHSLVVHDKVYRIMAGYDASRREIVAGIEGGRAPFAQAVPADLPVAPPAPEGVVVIAGDARFVANATDAQSGVARVEWLLDGRVEHVATAAPYDWRAPSSRWTAGEHIVVARAVDHVGNVAEVSLRVLAVPTEP